MASRFARNSLFGALAGSCTTTTSFLAGIIVARALGVEGTGVVAYALWLASIGLIFADVGFSHSIARYGPALTGAGKRAEFQGLAALLARMQLLTLSFTVVLGVIVANIPSLSVSIWSGSGAATSGSFTLDVPLLWGLVGASTAITTLSTYYYSYLRGRQNFSHWASLVLVSSILQITAILFGSWKFGIVGAIVGYLCGSLPAALASFALVRRAPSVPHELSRGVARYATFAWGSAIVAAFVWARIEVFILQHSWGSEAVGIFTAALAMSNLASQGPVQLSAGLLSLFSEQMGRNDTSGMHTSFQIAMRLMAFFVFPSCLGMAAIMPALLPLLYGSSFAGAVPAAVVMVFAAALTSPGVATANLLYAKERTDVVFIWGLFGAILSVAASFLLVPTFGTFGAACSRAFVQVVLCLTGYWFIDRRLHCPIPYASLVRLLLAAAFCAAAAAIPGFLIAAPTSILIAVPLGVGIYVLAVWLLRPLPEDDLNLLRDYAQRAAVILGLHRHDV